MENLLVCGSQNYCWLVGYQILIKFIWCCFSRFFCDILLLNVQMYLWLKLYTVPFFVSEQTDKISKGSNNYCSHCIYLSLCTYTPSERWSFSVLSSLHARLLRDCWRHPLFWPFIFACPLWSVWLSALLFLTLCLCSSTTILICSLVPLQICLLVLTPDWFLTFLLPSIFVLQPSDYLATKTWTLKTTFYCISPGLHLVPYPSITLFLTM